MTGTGRSELAPSAPGSVSPRRSPPPPAGGFACSGCGWVAPAGDPVPLFCPRAREGDDIDHVLALRGLDRVALVPADHGTANPFVRYRARSHAWQAAMAAGWSDDGYVALVQRLDDAVAVVDGHGFRITPFGRSHELSERLGFSDLGGVWVKDETGNVSGSHKARHLFGTLIELEVQAASDAAIGAERLAIASCGNAALAAAVVAAAAGRQLDVFIPPDADPVVVDRLRALGAHLEVCVRTPGAAGDPTVARLMAAVAAGEIPFTCQGNLNGFAVEGGLTLGWEIADQLATAGARLDRVVVQVGGGALAAGCAGGLVAGSDQPRFDTVQTGGAWPLRRSYERVVAEIRAGASIAEALEWAAHHRSAVMWPWEVEPHSVAHGILDDEAYDWLAVVRAMLETGGRPVVVDESTLIEANELAVAATGIPVDHTGSAGLAGLLALRASGEIDRDENVAVLFTGVRRDAPPDRSTDPSTGPSPAVGS